MQKLADGVPPLSPAGFRSGRAMRRAPVHEKDWHAATRTIERLGSRMRHQVLTNREIQRIQDHVESCARENAAWTLIEQYGRDEAKRVGNGFLDGHPEFLYYARMSVQDCLVDWYSREPRLTRPLGDLIQKRAEERFREPPTTTKKATKPARRRKAK